MAKKTNICNNSLKYKCGIFKILKESPTPNDILVCFGDKEYFTYADIIDLFGDDKKIVIDLSIAKLILNKKIKEENNRYYLNK